MTPLRVALVALVPVLLLAGCFGGGAEDKGVDLMKATTGNYRIAIFFNNTFSPQHAHVPVGAVVEWLDSGGTHDVTDDDHEPPKWSSYDRNENRTPLGFGDLYTHQFDEPGTYHYKCTIHGAMGMTGIITVG